MKISSSVSFGLLATRILAASASRPRRGVKNGILGGVGPYLPPGSVQEQYSTIWAGGQISAPDNDGIVHVNASMLFLKSIHASHVLRQGRKGIRMPLPTLSTA